MTNSPDLDFSALITLFKGNTGNTGNTSVDGFNFNDLQSGKLLPKAGNARVTRVTAPPPAVTLPSAVTRVTHGHGQLGNTAESKEIQEKHWVDKNVTRVTHVTLKNKQAACVHPVTLPPSIEGIPLDAIRRWAGADWPELAGNPDLLSAYVRAAIEAGELAPPPPDGWEEAVRPACLAEPRGGYNPPFVDPRVLGRGRAEP